MRPAVVRAGSTLAPGTERAQLLLGGVRGRQPGPTGGCLEATTLPRGHRPTAQAPQHRASEEGMNLYVKGLRVGAMSSFGS